MKDKPADFFKEVTKYFLKILKEFDCIVRDCSMSDKDARQAIGLEIARMVHVLDHSVKLF